MLKKITLQYRFIKRALDINLKFRLNAEKKNVQKYCMVLFKP